ncbi:hypothetical protein [Chryseobacterium populi]|uniref:hypothetical protein n=1 Tax=Chryseobacterium populi TaxID=1144316 RepID=UPI0002F1D1CE|nr:hypothetical protein [Chryseobacterium populi]
MTVDTEQNGMFVFGFSDCRNLFNHRIRQSSGLFRLSGIAVANIIVKQDNAVSFIPQTNTSGYWNYRTAQYAYHQGFRLHSINDTQILIYYLIKEPEN